MRKFEFVNDEKLKYDLESATGSDGKRTYVTPTGKRYPSITTVLSAYNKKHIMEWRQRVGAEEANKISRKAASRGTAVHSICEKYFLNEYTEMQLKMMMPYQKSLFQQLRPTLDSKIGKIYCLEQALYSDELGVAGRVDCIAEWDGVLSVIDFKTSTKIKEEQNIQNYFMQCTAYSLMFQERTEIPINQIVVAIATEEQEPQFFVKEKHPYIDPLKDFIDNYK